MSMPHETAVDGRPIPRYDRVASVTMKTPSEIVEITMTGPSELGMTCVNSVRSRVEPSEREASTNSSLRAEIAELRAMRAIWGQLKMASTTTTV